ncbi:cytochrome b [Alteromonas halophila]|uniref:Cytochrome b n=1 Tax=Alteromonas halophila TaxID=516698 RepID=A0A918JFC7_9ALTE|nr:cytochrome b [Alteromonas halophila]GGW78024.1 cytochrome b [Alteromonas halophila]
MKAPLRWNLNIIVIHWLSAFVVIGMFASGLWMVDLTYYSDWYKTAPHWHKSVGLLLAAVTLLRVSVRVGSSRPPEHGATWEIWLGRLGHLALYGLLFTLFASGYLISTADGRGIEIFNWVTVPGAGAFIEQQEDIAGEVHFYVAWSLIILASLHALAAFKHHFFNHDQTLKQMLGFTSSKN